MKITKKQIDMLTALPDDALRFMIKSLGEKTGYDLSGVNLSDSALAGIRSSLRSMNEEELNRAIEALRNRKKN